MGMSSAHEQGAFDAMGIVAAHNTAMHMLSTLSDTRGVVTACSMCAGEPYRQRGTTRAHGEP